MKLLEFIVLPNAQDHIFLFHTSTSQFYQKVKQPCVLEEARIDIDKKINSGKRMVKGEKKPRIYKENVTKENGQTLPVAPVNG